MRGNNRCGRYRAATHLQWHGLGRQAEPGQGLVDGKEDQRKRMQHDPAHVLLAGEKPSQRSGWPEARAWSASSSSMQYKAARLQVSSRSM
jgi:hypothetical protein